MIEAVIQDRARGEAMRTRWLPTDFYMQFMFSLTAPSWMFSMEDIFLEKWAQWDLSYSTDSFCVCVLCLS
jgi:hypothetical protein